MRPTAVVALVCAFAGACAPEPIDDRARVVEITGVDVLTLDGEGLLRSRTVVVRGSRIDAIRPGAEAPRVRPDTVIDGTGKVLAPGLVDAHVHLSVRSDLERYVAHGVTSVREMWGLPVRRRWRDAVAAGQIPGPNIVVASTYFWSDGPAATKHVEPTDTGAARRLVREAASEGYDLIKVVRVEGLDVLRAIVDEAHALGLTVSGHFPDRAVPVDEMLDAGMSSFEHADEFASLAFASDSSDAEIRRVARALAERGIGLTTILTPATKYLEIDARGGAYYTPEARVEILERLGRYYLRDAEQTIDNVIAAEGRYVKQWTEGTRLALRAAKTFVDEGVALGIGTEGIGPFFEVAGVGVHDEMALLARAGLSNEQVLRVATVNGARLLGFEGRKGRVREGYDADLLLLDGNPLEELAVLREPSAVLVMGRIYGRSALDALKQVY